eukprot:1157971-Pelagomonas_calceolata.AAC.4
MSPSTRQEHTSSLCWLASAFEHSLLSCPRLQKSSIPAVPSSKHTLCPCRDECCPSCADPHSQPSTAGSQDPQPALWAALADKCCLHFHVTAPAHVAAGDDVGPGLVAAAGCGAWGAGCSRRGRCRDCIHKHTWICVYAMHLQCGLIRDEGKGDLLLVRSTLFSIALYTSEVDKLLLARVQVEPHIDTE